MVHVAKALAGIADCVRPLIDPMCLPGAEPPGSSAAIKATAAPRHPTATAPRRMLVRRAKDAGGLVG